MTSQQKGNRASAQFVDVEWDSAMVDCDLIMVNNIFARGFAQIQHLGFLSSPGFADSAMSDDICSQVLRWIVILILPIKVTASKTAVHLQDFILRDSKARKEKTKVSYDIFQCHIYTNQFEC